MSPPTFEEQYPEFGRVRELWDAGRLGESADLLETLPLSAELSLARAQQLVYAAAAAGEDPPIDELRRLLAEASELAPGNPNITIGAGLIAFQAEDYRSVQDRLRELHTAGVALEREEDAAAVFLIGMIAWWLGRMSKVEAPLRMAVKLDPTDPTYRRALDRFVTGQAFPGPRL